MVELLGMYPSVVWRLDPSRGSSEALQALLHAWPEVSSGRPTRRAALREAAARSGSSGLSPAIKDALA